MSTRWIAATLLIGSFLFAGPVTAQDEDETPDSRSETFEAASGPQTENLPGGALMMTAYGLVWLVLLGYVASIGFRQAATNRQLEELRRDLTSRDE